MIFIEKLLDGCIYVWIDDGLQLKFLDIFKN